MAAEAATKPLFSVDDMLAAASAATGLDDFGDEEFREALMRLVDSTNEESSLSPIGAAAFRGDMQRLLVNRLRFAADLKKHPEILDEDVSDPIVVLGLPRTGTTKLQRLLATDPDVQRLEYWRLFNPAPFPNMAPGQPDPRVAAAKEALTMMAQLMPGWSESHPTAVDAVDEEVFLQLFTFKCVFTHMSRPVPSYRAWYNTQSQRGTYRYMKQMLQYLQWQDGGKQNRPWIMKSPAHVGNVDLVLELFPQATLVMTHRPPRQALRSHCRLMEVSWRLFSDNVDKAAIGRAVLDDFPGELRKHLKLRDQMANSSNPLPIYDVMYDDLKHDAMTVVREIYRRAGRELTPKREQAMRAWEAQQHSHREGSYQADDYGITNEMIDDSCREYIGRFIT